jgi:hypothetical protein
METSTLGSDDVVAITEAKKPKKEIGAMIGAIPLTLFFLKKRLIVWTRIEA